MFESYEQFFREKDNVFNFIQNRVDGKVVFCSCVGSFVYHYSSLSSEIKSNDLDLICVVENNLNKLDSKSNENLKLNYKNTVLDIQILSDAKFRELLDKQHLFYFESIFTPKDLILKSSDYLKKFKFNEDTFNEHLEDNKSKTLKRAEKSFKEFDYLSGKRYINHLLRIENFSEQLKSSGLLNTNFLSPIEDFIDDSPISFDEFVEILNIDRKKLNISYKPK